MLKRGDANIKAATGRTCVLALTSNSRRLEDASTHRSPSCELRYVSDQLAVFLGALGRKRLQFHCNRRRNAIMSGTCATPSNWRVFSNAGIILTMQVHTDRLCVAEQKRRQIQTKRTYKVKSETKQNDVFWLRDYASTFKTDLQLSIIFIITGVPRDCWHRGSPDYFHWHCYIIDTSCIIASILIS